MPLQKQQVAVNFQKGLDTKSDPWQVPLGNFLELQNSVFTKQGLLQKRNGFKQISSLNDTSVSTITTFNNELTAIGNSLYAYNQPNQNFVNKGIFYPVEFRGKNLIANNSDIKQIDMATSPNGLTCAVWWESINPTTHSFKYSVIDTSSQQSIINPTNIVPTAGAVSGVPKVFYVNGNFVVIFPKESAGVQQLQYFYINCSSLSVSSSAVLTNLYTPNPNAPWYTTTLSGLSWDAVVVGNQIHVGYNRGANGFHVSIIKSDLTVSVTVQIDATTTPSSVGAMTDGSFSYFAYENYSTRLGKIVGVNGVTGVPVLKFAPQNFFDFTASIELYSEYVPNITGSVIGNTITVVYEQPKIYGYFPNPYQPVFTNQIYKRTCTTAGVVGAAPINSFIKGVGLSSKSFVMNNEMFFCTTYSYGNGILGEYSVFTNQPCYFVNDINGKVLSQFSYRNGAGYNGYGLPNVSITSFYGSTIAGSNQVTNIDDTNLLYVGQRLISTSFPVADCYIKSIESSSTITLSRIATATANGVLFADPTVNFPYLYQAVSQSFGGSATGEPVVFGLSGAKIAELELYKPQIKSVEAAKNLNIASGFLWNYDGFSATENNFFLHPDSIYVTGSPIVIDTACNTTLNSPLVKVTSTANLAVGQFVSGPGISGGISYSKTGNTTAGSYIVGNINTDNLEAGQFVSGAGIYAGTKIVSISQTGLTITLSNPVTATGIAVALTITTGCRIVAIVDATNVYINISATATAAGVTLSFFGGLSAGNYFYSVTYESVDNQGNITRSTPSIPFEFTVKPSATITATLTVVGGDGKLSALSSSDFAKLQVGQMVSGVGITNPNTYITQLNSTDPSNLYALINQPPAIPGVGVTITLTAVTQSKINIPTLRLSYKENVNINIYKAATLTGGIPQQIIPVRTPLKNNPLVDYVTYIDPTLNEDITANNILYTNGGILDNEPPPPCSDLTIFNDRLWLIDSENGSKLWFSKPLVEGSSVEMSSLETIYVSGLLSEQSDVEGLSAITIMDDKLIIFKGNSIYYLNGTGPDSTGANSQYSDPIFITGTVGCLGPSSITYNPMGVIFQSNKGIWILDRNLGTNYFGAPVERYTENALITSAKLIPNTNQSRFSLNSGTMLMYDYFYGQWGTFVGIPNISTCVYNNLHTFLDQYGRICQETPNTYLDVLNPVLMSFTTSWFALAGIQGFERAYFLFLLGKYYSPHKLNVELAYDFNSGYTQSTVITPDNYATVYGTDPFYGSSEFWGGPTQVEKWRIMLEKQKCDTVQIKISEIYDASYGVTAGAGLTLSGMNFIIGVKKGYGTISQFNTAG